MCVCVLLATRLLTVYAPGLECSVCGMAVLCRQHDIHLLDHQEQQLLDAMQVSTRQQGQWLVTCQRGGNIKMSIVNGCQ